MQYGRSNTALCIWSIAVHVDLDCKRTTISAVHSLHTSVLGYSQSHNSEAKLQNCALCSALRCLTTSVLYRSQVVQHCRYKDDYELCSIAPTVTKNEVRISTFQNRATALPKHDFGYVGVQLHFDVCCHLRIIGKLSMLTMDILHRVL